YAAERGIDYTIAELKLNSNFKNYKAEDLNGDQIWELNQLATPPTPQLANVYMDANKCYASNFPNSKSQFLVKIYSDPYTIGETVILSKGIANGQTVLLVTKYVPSSLYRYFIFTPYDFWPNASTYDAGGGSIHANGYFWLTNGTIYSNIHELSISKYFKYYYRYFVPPAGTATTTTGATPTNPRTGAPFTWDEVFYGMRYPFVAGNNTTVLSLKYTNFPDGYQYGSWGHGLLWQHPTNSSIYSLGQSYPALPGGTIPEDYILDPYTPANFGRYACNSYLASCSNENLNGYHTVINNIKIPNYFSTGYNFNKYYQLDATTGGYGAFGYSWAYPPSTITKYQFDSQYQTSDWASFLTSQHAPGGGPTLSGVVKDANTGGTHIEPLSIAGALYSTKAQNYGIYIHNFGGGYVGVKIKNYNHGAYVYVNTGGGNINGVNGVFELKSFMDQNSAETKDVVTLDIGKLKQALGPNAGLDQNIIYSDYPIVLTNARDILDNGLTTVCENSIYLHGNYNDKPTGETFKPSSAISARHVYTLSGSWNYPQDLQFTFHNPDYPNKWDFYCPAGNSSCISSLISSGRNSTEVTYPDTGSPYYTNGFNWYAEHYNQMANPVPQDSDPIEPGTNPYAYNIAFVGKEGYSPSVLERWWDYTSAGDSTTPPGGWSGSKIYSTRNISGAQIRLQSGDFDGSGLWEWTTRRCCGAANQKGTITFSNCTGTLCVPCADCNTYVDSNPSPTYGSTINSAYSTEFADGDVPPGDLVGYSSTVFKELDDNTTNWTKHYKPISMIREI
ncbi:MAG: hypothetical protein PHI86_04310, partial [Candidatus Omnitrophica bacterium]|nr:hypothetical protein [Candidatus Omnitrophota bacterium]